MAGADVVGGERQPGAVGFRNRGADLFLEDVEVAGPGQDAFLWIEPVADAEPVGGFLGKHHDAAHVGVARRVRVPVRLVVGDRGDQPPVDAGDRLRGIEMFAQTGQGGLDLAHEFDDVGLVEAAHVADVAVFEAGQGAVELDALDEIAGARRQFGIGVPAE